MASSKNSKDKSKEDKAPVDMGAEESPKVVPEDIADDVVVSDDMSDPTTSDEDTVAAADPDVAADSAEADSLTAEKPDTIVDTSADADPMADFWPGAEAESDAKTIAENAEARAEAADPDLEAATATAATVAPQVVRETVVEKSNSFFPALLGGVIAASAGFLGAQYASDEWPFGGGTPADDPFRAQITATIDTQQGAVDALTNRLGAVESTVGGIDTTAVETSVSDLAAQVAELSEQASGMADQIGLLEVRLVTLEKAPIAETVSPDAIAAYERELEALKTDITEQRREIEAMVEDAVASEQNAAAQAELAKARAALAELTSALETGKPFQDSVSTIAAANEVSVPNALSAAAAQGVPTLAALSADFPDAARTALAAARDTGAAGEQDSGGFLSGFLRDQLGARSVTPREGDDPDAVLSRAEAALKSGDLAAALGEIELLPEEAKTAMADWIAQAQSRVQAQTAVTTLSQELNK